MLFCEICEILKNTFLQNTSGRGSCWKILLNIIILNALKYFLETTEAATGDGL